MLNISFVGTFRGWFFCSVNFVCWFLLMLVCRYVFDGKPPDLKKQELAKRYFMWIFCYFREFYFIFLEWGCYIIIELLLIKSLSAMVFTLKLIQLLQESWGYWRFVRSLRGICVICYWLSFLVLFLSVISCVKSIYSSVGCFFLSFRLPIRKTLKNSVNVQWRWVSVS